MKKQARKVATTFALIALTVGMASTAAAEETNNTETSSVDVTVSSTTALDVKPDQLTYTGIEVGERATETDNDHGYTSIKVENTGSEAIDQVWMDTSFPDTNPFGEGDANLHDSANFLQVKPSNTSSYTSLRGDSDTFHYVQRAEFFQDTSPLVELDDFEYSGTETEGYNESVGRIRAGDNEFYFALAYDGNSCAEADLRVGNTPVQPDTMGTNDFSNDNSDEWTQYDISAANSGDSYGVTNDSVTLELANPDENQTYDIMTKCSNFNPDNPSEPHLMLTKYNIEAGGHTNLFENDGNTATQIWRTSTNDLEPGQSFATDIAVQVPRGVPAGSVSTGTLTVYSQSATFS